MPLATLLLATLIAASPAPRKRSNMPPGWTWPPSEAMQAAGSRCLTRLDAGKVTYQRDQATKKVATPILLTDRSIGGIALVPLRVQRRYTLDCHLAAALAAVAPGLRALGVRALHYRTMHELRTVRRGGRSLKTLSRHALGLALDVFEVAFDDGRVLRVKGDWRRHGRLLPRVAAVFTRSADFRNPLTPANDPADHGDHLHIEAEMPL